MRDCARFVNGNHCGRPFAAARLIKVLTAVTAPEDLTYLIQLCQEHLDEYDREHV